MTDAIDNSIDNAASTIDMTCAEFANALASKAPTPGGGGAAAYAGAIGIALGHMVGALTLGKKKYADVQDEIAGLMRQAEALQTRLYELVDADAKVFEPLSQAYGLPTNTEEEIAYKSETMEKCLRDACEVPLQIMGACCEAIDLLEGFASSGSKIAISDAGCGATICAAALRAASLNVFINTKAMQDRKYAGKSNLEAERMLDIYTAKADSIFKDVEAQLT